ncbi:MAG TPA: carboxylate--amine ligase, partial [Alphaproteobacteria bacterium]|nr:carboxylate--amine ligase [Alphaproteobacteria bacterium]
MNFVFFSPHFPSSCTDFCHHLKREGANVLGIGDAPYEALSGKLRDSLTEYYRIADMEDYDQVLRAVGHLTHRHGKIDRFESLNEHWLELEARIRTDFNIAGTKLDFIDNLKHKSRMKAFFERSGVDTARHHEVRDYAAAQDFVRSVGYPVVAKPDEGSGAANTYKITSDAEFDAFFAGKPAGVEFILQEFIDGIVVTYDGLVDRDGR